MDMRDRRIHQPAGREEPADAAGNGVKRQGSAPERRRDHRRNLLGAGQGRELDRSCRVDLAPDLTVGVARRVSVVIEVVRRERRDQIEPDRVVGDDPDIGPSRKCYHGPAFRTAGGVMDMRDRRVHQPGGHEEAADPAGDAVHRQDSAPEGGRRNRRHFLPAGQGGELDRPRPIELPPDLPGGIGIRVGVVIEVVRRESRQHGGRRGLVVGDDEQPRRLRRGWWRYGSVSPPAAAAGGHEEGG